MRNIRHIPVILMAGGLGRRIGGDKAARLLDGVRLLEHALRIARGYSNDIAVSANGDFNLALLQNTPLIADEYDRAGPISGLLSALRFARSKRCDHVMIMSCDTPFLPTDLMEKLHSSIAGDFAAVAQYEGDLHPACSLWHTDAERFLPAYIEQGHRSLIGFAKAVGYVPVEWTKASHDPFFNINTVEDLAVAEKFLKEVHKPI